MCKVAETPRKTESPWYQREDTDLDQELAVRKEAESGTVRGPSGQCPGSHPVSNLHQRPGRRGPLH